MSEQPFSFKTLSLAARPARVIILINSGNPDWQDTILRIIEWFSFLWGGAYGLIVPTDGEKIDSEFWFLMENFDPDYIYYYKKTKLDVKLAKPAEYKEWIERETEGFLKKNPESGREDTIAFIEKQIDHFHIESFSISSALEAELNKRLNPFEETIPVHWINAASKPHYPLTDLGTAFRSMSNNLTIFSPKIDASKELQLCLYSIVGKANERLIDDDAKVDGQTLEFYYRYTYPIYNGENIQELIQAALNQPELYRETPFQMTMVGLSYYSKTYAANKKPVIILGGTLKDFCLYYNLSRMKKDTYWLPDKIMNSYIEEKSLKKRNIFEGEASYLYRLRDTVKEIIRSQSEQRYFLYTSSLQEGEINLFKKTFDDVCILIPKESISGQAELKSNIKELLHDILRIYEEDMPKKIYVEQFYQGESVNFLNTPMPRKFPKIPPHGHYWITEVSIDGYLPPKIKSLGPKSITYKNYDTHFARVSSEGFSYFCPHFAYFVGWGGIENIVVKPKLRIFEDFEIIEDLFKEAGYHVKYSDKGDYHRETCTKVGCFDKLADFLIDEKKRNLLVKYLDTSASRDGEGTYLDSERRRYLYFKEIENILSTNSRDVVDSLLERGILYRGFIFKCQKCRNAAWYPIDDVSSRFKCSRCKTEQLFRQVHWREPSEPRWYYKLDEVVYLGMKHNMHVPVLALMKLKKTATVGFHYTPEIELRKDPLTEKPYLEIDFVAIVNGRVAIGEATVENELADSAAEEKEKLFKLKEVAVSVQCKKIVFATLSDGWSERTKSNIKDIFNDISISPVFFTKQEMLTIKKT